MSTFLGHIEEIPDISVDRFDEENLNSSAFFLSHCHSDHMIGLDNAFFNYLKQYKKFLYCSSISKSILEIKFNLENFSQIKQMDIDVPILIEYNRKENDTNIISVTCISAGHCPGSVMFLFEANGKAILYTGDFRINPKDFPKLKFLHFREGSRIVPKTLDKVYLDTTFLTPDFYYLPSRQESLVKICEATKQWLNEDPRNVVVLECSALYGSEFLYMELSKFFSCKVHVKDPVYHLYSRIVELATSITNDGQSTRVHACKNKHSRTKLPCRFDVDVKNIMTIVASVLKWRTGDAGKVIESDQVRKRTLNVCYSTHSSLEELTAFLRYFTPVEIFPCVCPPESENEIFALLSKIKNNSADEIPNRNIIYKLSLLENKHLPEPKFKSEYVSDDDDL